MRTLGIVSLICTTTATVIAYHLSDAYRGTGTFQTASAVTALPALTFWQTPTLVEFEQRHALRGVKCADCHGPDPSMKLPTMAQCLQCHRSYADLARLTKDVFPNPHHSHMGEVACDQCHREHEKSVLSCNQCHVFEIEVP